MELPLGTQLDNDVVIMLVFTPSHPVAATWNLEATPDLSNSWPGPRIQQRKEKHSTPAGVAPPLIRGRAAPHAELYTHVAQIHTLQ